MYNKTPFCPKCQAAAFTIGLGGEPEPIPCSCRVENNDEAMTRAYRIINVLSQEAKDEKGKPWKDALDWLHEFEEFRPKSE